MCSDGIIDFVEKGVITNKYKHIHPNKSVISFALGSRKLYDFVDDNPSSGSWYIAYVNDPHVIRRNDNMVAINSAIELELQDRFVLILLVLTSFWGRRTNGFHERRSFK